MKKREIETKMIKCGNCGKNVSDFAEVCPNCGHIISIQSTRVVNAKRNSEQPHICLIAKILIGFAIIVFAISTFVFASALNAYNAIIGKSVLGLGSIFFEQSVINHTIQPVVISAVCTGVVAFIAIAVIVICLISILRNKIKK